METDGGGWTLFQRRQDGSVNFNRLWADYKNGFGDLTGEFWLGLSKIHRLTQAGLNTLRVEVGDFEGSSSYAKYSTFSIGGAGTEYRLNVSGYSGPAGDSLSFQGGSSFSTRDNINDDKNCPMTWGGGWWFNHGHKYYCFYSHLNGYYKHQPNTDPAWHGIMWNTYKNGFTLKNAEMKIR